MKILDEFKELIGCDTADAAFDYFKSTLNKSNTGWDYFVNWGKVYGNVREIEIDLNTLNYLVGKEDIEKAFKELLRRQGSLVRLIPILLACRENNFTILTNHAGGEFQYETFNFKNKQSLTDDEIDRVYKFALNTGLLAIFQNKTIKSIPDYAFGVEVGLDSNGRKNRGGTTMERIVEDILQAICTRMGIDCMPQATAARVRAEWGIDLRVDKSSRRFDFAVRKSKKLCLIETNYYGGGGSKLKATAGEYKFPHDFLSADGHAFVWVTDGTGWNSTLRPLEETFHHIDYTLNLKMICMGLLEAVLNHEL
jgi:type II restriction enzyme